MATKRVEKILGASIALVCVGCAQPALLKSTHSGWPEAIWPGISIDEAKNEMVLMCSQNGAAVETDAYSVTCGKKNEGGSGVMAQALLGNSFSQTPWEKVRFTFANTAGGVFVSAQAWMEMTMGFGEVRRIEYSNNNTVRNNIQQMLDRSTANLEARRASSSGGDVPRVPDIDSWE